MRVVVYSPENVKHAIHNRSRFCIEHKLNYLGFCNMIKGKSRSYKGWRLNPDMQVEPVHGREKELKIVIAPDGTTAEVINRAEFCRKHGLNYQGFMGMLSGRSKSYKGWTLNWLG